jgi:2-dehydro-3-deoxygluconokinase
MVLLDPLSDGRPVRGSQLELRVAGAESNFAVALRRLGVEAAWASSVGTDPLGDVVIDTLASEGIDLTYVNRRPGAPTGLFLKWREAGRSHVIYHRRGSAASLMNPGLVPDEAFEDVDLVHLTGITMALGSKSGELVTDVARRAQARGITVIFDPNYRPALWRDPETAQAVQRSVFEHIDWYLCGAEEGHLLFGTNELEELIAAIHGHGVSGTAVRIGSEGAVVSIDGDVRTAAPDRLETVLDEIGAGDGFDAGFAYGLLMGWAPVDCARCGNVIAAHALRGTGDWETFPTLGEIEDRLPTTER